MDRFHRSRAGLPHSGWSPFGFTLVELLVVVGIIALLISILLPTLASVRVAANRTASASNMRQIGLAISMYCDDNKGRFPSTTHGGSSASSWIYLLERYVTQNGGAGVIDKVRIDPADPLADQRRANGGTSYILNEYIAVPLEDPFGGVIEDYTQRNRIRKPSEAVIVFESASNSTNEFGDHTHSRSWFDPAAPVDARWNAVLADIAPDRHATRRLNSRTKGHTNFLFLDAHVEPIEAAQVRRWIETGNNFAIPR